MGSPVGGFRQIPCFSHEFVGGGKRGHVNTLYTHQNGCIKKSAPPAYHPDNDLNLAGLSLRRVSLVKSGV